MAFEMPKQKAAKRMPVERLEAKAAEETNEIMTAFEARAKNEQARLLDATDSEFWVAMCFQTREQKDEFLRKAGLLPLGDKYLDGMKVAKAMGITLESPVPPNRRITKFGGAYLKRVIPQ